MTMIEIREDYDTLKLLNNELPTVLIIHGYLADKDAELNHLLASAYHDTGKYNVSINLILNFNF